MLTSGFLRGDLTTAISPAPSRAFKLAYFALRFTPKRSRILVVRTTLSDFLRPASNQIANPTASGDLPGRRATAESHDSGIGPFRNSPCSLGRSACTGPGGASTDSTGGDGVSRN